MKRGNGGGRNGHKDYSHSTGAHFTENPKLIPRRTSFDQDLFKAAFDQEPNSTGDPIPRQLRLATLVAIRPSAFPHSTQTPHSTG